MPSKSVPLGTLLLWTALTKPVAYAQDQEPEIHNVPVHNALEAKYFISLVDMFASRAFDVTAKGSITPQIPQQFVDFESDLNVDDSPELFVFEFRWQFGQKWNLGLQYFDSTRRGREILEKRVEWNDQVFDVGAEVRGETNIEITRIVLSRHFIRKGGHDLRIAGGIHWLDASAAISGEATLGDGSTGFAVSKASASLPIPNVGAVYQYSPSSKWLFSARADWFSASVGEYSGGIWNTMASANYQITERIGLGAGYQFFQLDGALEADRWRGDLRIRFDGPFLQISGFW
ncbi:MAG: hypothetical protein ACR2QS_05505 [Woeseiaceae bacterium]